MLIIIIITIINIDIIINFNHNHKLINKDFLPEVEVTWYNIDIRACYCYKWFFKIFILKTIREINLLTIKEKKN